MQVGCAALAHEEGIEVAGDAGLDVVDHQRLCLVRRLQAAVKDRESHELLVGRCAARVVVRVDMGRLDRAGTRWQRLDRVRAVIAPANPHLVVLSGQLTLVGEGGVQMDSLLLIDGIGRQLKRGDHWRRVLAIGRIRQHQLDVVQQNFRPGDQVRAAIDQVELEPAGMTCDTRWERPHLVEERRALHPDRHRLSRVCPLLGTRQLKAQLQACLRGVRARPLALVNLVIE